MNWPSNCAMTGRWTMSHESYKWRKVDPDTDEAKKMIVDYFTWEGVTMDGKEFNQCKIFK
jgi:elongation factor 1-gamma